MERLAAVLVTVMLATSPAHRGAGQFLFREIQQSSDIAWLERLCSDLRFAESAYADRGRNTAGVKGNRSAAYVRLGAIGSSESLAAIARIEKAAFERTTLPGPVNAGGRNYHPAPHMSDGPMSPAARTSLAGGGEAVVYLLNWYGPTMLFVALQRSGKWTPPSMIPGEIGPFLFPQVALSELPQQRLRLTFSAPAPQGNMPRVEPTPDAIEVSIGELTRDTDGDGWTDITERHLGLSWQRADSDGDGIADDRDASPTVSALSARIGEDEHILQRAIFSMFGLTESPGALVVSGGSKRLQLFGLPGPVLYDEQFRGVRVTWKLVDKTADTATVELTDYEGPLAASGNDVTLKKIDGAWYVTSIKMKWIS